VIVDSNLPKKSTDFSDILLGVGTWSWGDQLMWGYGRGYKDEDIEQVFQACLDAGITFFDTAEVYGQGRSELLIGQFLKKKPEEKKVVIGTKFMPYPWRLGKGSMKRALGKSLGRLGTKYVDLYQIHWPMPPVTIEVWMDAFTELMHAGLIKMCGVSNYDREQMQRAYDALIHDGVYLASNQVEFNLLNRKIEKNGLLAHAKDLGVKIIAYSPLSMGVLSGKYTPENPPSGIRGRRFSPRYLQKVKPLIALLTKIGVDHGGKSNAQVALNWVISKGALPIPGAKTLLQLQQNIGALGWNLTETEVALLDDASDHFLVD
jgi:aryl-alcohol dehydrogenase-like predicted oxidoreductase